MKGGEPLRWELGLYGAVGASLWLLLVYGFPLAWKATAQGIDWQPTVQKALGITAVICLSLLFGAVAPLIVQADALKEAVVAGLGWQGLFGQYARPAVSDS